MIPSPDGNAAVIRKAGHVIANVRADQRARRPNRSRSTAANAPTAIA